MIDLKPSINFWHDLKSNQRAGMWLFLGSRKSLQIVRPSILQLIFWGILGASASSLFSWLLSNGDGEFNSQGLVSYALWPFIALIVGIFLSQRTNNPRLMLVPALLWLVLDTYIVFFQCLIQYYFNNFDYQPNIFTDQLQNIFSLLFVWQSLAVIWVFSRELKWPWWERLLIMIGTFITLSIWQISSQSQPIWKVEEVQPTFSEQAFYTQSKLLNQSLEQIKFGEFAETHWYFMGVAGASYQDVFKLEIQRIREQFDTRFGTYGRSIALINNPATRTEIPLASKTSMDLALQRIGSQMNRDSDVLFLYMTSHGLANQFQMENAPLDLDDVDPKWLRETLDKSGIRWKVIVISACYSGSFIPALQSPDTLIITASAADRDSFGCSSESDYTYFGHAFFEQAMREKDSLKKAFEEASITISTWEQAQGFPASEPQWVIGKNMELMLPQLEKRLFPQKGASSLSQNSGVELNDLNWNNETFVHSKP